MNRKGFGLTSAIVEIAVVAVIMLPLTKWFMSLSSGTNELATRSEMQSIVQDYWSQINLATYNDFQDAIAAKGKKWKDEVGEKYDLTIEFSDDGKYADTGCKVGVEAGTDDRHCRNVTITLASKNNPLIQESLESVRVSMPGESEVLLQMKQRILSNEGRFSQYYTKSEEEVRYVHKNERP